MAEVQRVTAHPLTAVAEPERLERVEVVRRRSRAATSWARTALLLDAAMLLAAAVAAGLGARSAGLASVSVFWLAAFVVAALVFLHSRSLYDWHLRLQTLDDVRSVLVATVLAAMTIVSVQVILPGDLDDVASQTFRVAAFAAVYVAAGRVALDWSQLRARRAGEIGRPTLVVGAGRVGHLAARRLLEHPELGLKPVGFLDKEPMDDPRSELPVLGASWDLERVIAEHRIEHVLITFSTAPNDVLLRELRRCEELGVDVSVVPRLFEQVTRRVDIDHLGGLPLLRARRPDPKGLQFAFKYIVDRVVAGFLLLLGLPLLLAIALGVRISLGAPIFFRQRRVGLDGREFEMLKFRSMRSGEGLALVPDLPADTAPGGIEGDDRRTRLGAFLRSTSLDELPQLLNVLRGEMSLVGPRPERPEFVRLFEHNVYRYGDRHRVKSGITGWSQVNGLRGKTSLSDRVEWDNWYIENWSLWLDFKILLGTLVAAFRPARPVE
jgi:exopolysaccharide biosynthesis polyprenyl glycosylphosphotransferase